jgi:hypothetical protein
MSAEGSIAECRVLGNEPRIAAFRGPSRPVSAAASETVVHGCRVECLVLLEAAIPLLRSNFETARRSRRAEQAGLGIREGSRGVEGHSSRPGAARRGVAGANRPIKRQPLGRGADRPDGVAQFGRLAAEVRPRISGGKAGVTSLRRRFDPTIAVSIGRRSCLIFRLRVGTGGGRRTYSAVFPVPGPSCA